MRSWAHITLHRPFVWKEEKEDELIKKLDAFRFERSFEIVLKDFAFFEPRVIYVDVVPHDALNEFHDRLTQNAKRELKLFNEADDLRGFHAHVTIANRDLKKPMFYELKNEFENKNFDATFECNGFSLLRLEEKWEEAKKF